MYQVLRRFKLFLGLVALTLEENQRAQHDHVDDLLLGVLDKLALDSGHLEGVELELTVRDAHGRREALNADLTETEYEMDEIDSFTYGGTITAHPIEPSESCISGLMLRRRMTKNCPLSQGSHC